jgi:hypothetical protein
MNPPKTLIPSNRNLILIAVATIYGILAAFNMAKLRVAKARRAK